jgi:hypothetical protein
MNSQEVTHFIAQFATSRSDSEKFIKVYGPEKLEPCVTKDIVERDNEELSFKTSSTVAAFNCTHNSCI